MIGIGLVCSGDNDAVVPVTGTLYAFDSLALPVKVPWYAWYQQNQVLTFHLTKISP